MFCGVVVAIADKQVNKHGELEQTYWILRDGEDKEELVFESELSHIN